MNAVIASNSLVASSTSPSPSSTDTSDLPIDAQRNHRRQLASAA